MKQTDNYHLSQWDMTDRIEMKDFNADNANIEAALTALNTELGKKALASTFNSEITSLKNSKLQFDTLVKQTFTVSGSPCVYSLSGLGLDQYAIVALHVSAESTLTNKAYFCFRSVENDSTGLRYVIGGSGSSTGFMEFQKGRDSLAVFFPMKQPDLITYGVSFGYQAVSLCHSVATWGNLQSLLIKPPSGTASVSGSMYLRIYGIK